MAECSEIEAGGEVRTVKDATARQGVEANTAAIEEINAMIPANASLSNKMATQLDILKLFPSTQITDCNSDFYGVALCGQGVAHLPNSVGAGTLISFMKTGAQYPRGVQFFIPFQGYDSPNLYFRDNTNGYSAWRKLTGQII